jgi:hypothetical protein
MTLGKLAAIAPVIAALAISAPAASARAATAPGTPGSQIPCYPFPAWCGPDGKPLSPWPFIFPLPVTLPVPLYPYPGLRA